MLFIVDAYVGVVIYIYIYVYLVVQGCW